MKAVPSILGTLVLMAVVAACATSPAAPTAPATAATAGRPAATATVASSPTVPTPGGVGGTPVASPVAPLPPVVMPTAAPSASPTAAATPTASGSSTATPATPRATASAAAPATARITTAGGKQVVVRTEVADTSESRSVGLSRRPSLPEDAGMLFVFPGEDQAAFWMKDTLIPLSIAFIASDGRILEIQDMEPLSEALHRPAQRYRYALEVNQGFFKKNEVNAGDRVEFQLGGR